jgi:peptidyl-prolyl cis-trans isomerase SurA
MALPISKTRKRLEILRLPQGAACVAFFLLGWAGLKAQPIDYVVAIVGEDMVLRSDLDAQVDYFIQGGEVDDGTLKCRVLEKLIIEKLLLNKAKQDSLSVSDNEVEGELDRRIEYFCKAYGGCDKLEGVYGKSLVEIREELRTDIRDQLLIERQRDAIFGDVKVTPRDVEKFFKTIPNDSLPLMPAQVELYHIVAKPGYSEMSKANAKAKLAKIRDEIAAGKIDFAEAAKKNSMDYGSGKVGGSLGEFSRGAMVPEFEGAAYSLREGEMSSIVETEFGFHLILLQKRVGEMLTASHILIRPEHTEEDDSNAVRKLRMIRAAILRDSITFEQAAVKFSDDQSTRNCGGCIRNPQTGDNHVPLDLLDVDFFFKVDKMKEGQISEVNEWTSPGGDKAYHIIQLSQRIPPHKLNLKDDYQQIKEAAMNEKKMEALDQWFVTAKKNIFIDIKEESCLSILSNWNQ